MLAVCLLFAPLVDAVPTATCNVTVEWQVPQDPQPLPAPAGETAKPNAGTGVESEMGGNPEPVPTDRYLLERLLAETPIGPVLGDAGIRIYGWTQGSYTASSTDRSNAPTVFNDRADEVVFGQNWTEIVRPIDPSRAELQLGGRVALILPGYDYKYTLARGMWNDQERRHGFDTVYAYAELFVPGVGPRGTTFRAGRWGTTIGYEMIEAVATPFVTRSYNFAANPYTHTGVQATTELSATVVMYHGIVTGADVFLDPAATFSYVGGVKWTAEDGSRSAAVNVFLTGEGFDARESFQHYNSYNLLLTQTVAEGWTYVLDATLGRAPDTDPAGTVGGGSASWYGLANYLSHQVREQLTLNLRGEFFHDDDGLRTGTAGDFVGLSAGLQWESTPWLWLRPFARFDHCGKGPFEGDEDLWSGGLEVIARW
ncbi:MAG: outer membrane beta-barrel protein [Planctomycetota bacterium]